MSETQDNSHAIEAIKCEERRVERAMVEFEGRNLCRGCLEAIGWIKRWSSGEEKVKHTCLSVWNLWRISALWMKCSSIVKIAIKLLWIEIAGLKLYFDVRDKYHTVELLFHCNNVVCKSLLLKLSM